MDGTLGDFRIVREVGKGGMGIVYEAEQISLRRRVALKVLPFAATMDPRHLQRFHNEAQAAASLHHTNIVPVYFIGCEREVHFYAMQLINGQPLSEVIRKLQHTEKQASTVRREAAIASRSSGAEPASTLSPAAELTPLTDNGRRPRDYFRKVAELGIQAAEALDQAHQLGIVHRDIKPGNLLLDNHGKLWVTDFGLAHMQHGEASLTMTGQAVGTPRYMSPEQASAKRVGIDHRTDVYSLGVTLYELLTLRPAFASEDRQELLRQIAFEDPIPPRRLNREIAPELETIVLKAMDKDPMNRYATAKGLADDLRCFLEDSPIQARRPSSLQRLRRLARRHRAATIAIAACLLVSLTVLAGSIGWSLADRAARRRSVEDKARPAFEQATWLQDHGLFAEALSAVMRAEGLLDAEGYTELRHDVQERRKDLEMLLELEKLRLDTTGNPFKSDQRYQQAFHELGIDVDVLEPAIAAHRIRERSIRTELVVVLDSWAVMRLRIANWKNRGEHLLILAGMADTDAWRSRLRDTVLRPDAKVVKELATAEAIRSQPAASLILLASLLTETGALKEALAFLRRAQRLRPNDLWINFNLAILCLQKPRQPDDALRFAMIAVALQPDSPSMHNTLGTALSLKGQLDDAIAEYQKALELDPKVALVHNNLGITLRDKGRVDEAIAEFKQALGLRPDSAGYHNDLGNALKDKGRVDEAIAEFHKALELDPKFASPHNNLGNVLQAKGRMDEAIAEFQKAIELNPKSASPHNNLGSALSAKGHADEAVAEFKKALELDPEYALAHNNLGNALKDKGRVDEAIAAYQKAIELKPKFTKAHYNLANTLYEKGRLNDDIAEYQKTIELDPKSALAHNNLGSALADKGQLDEAIAKYQKSIDLDSKYANPHNNLGNALKNKGRVDEAIAEYNKALKLDPKFGLAHYNLGNALKDKGRVDEAIPELQKAIELDPKYVSAHNTLGIALLGKSVWTRPSASSRRPASSTPGSSVLTTISASP
jgi:tetratricopeptide (TPR) repeat protein